jgi:hypothetical protein
MRVRVSIILMSVLLTISAQAAKAEFLLGLVVANELLGSSLEWAGEASSTYLVLGSYQSKAGYQVEDMTAYVGHRRYAGGVFAKSSFFGGVLLGDLGGGPNFNRPGIGGEAGYQWLTENLRVSLNAGVVILGEPSGASGTGSTSDPEPASFIGAGAAIRF